MEGAPDQPLRPAALGGDGYDDEVRPDLEQLLIATSRTFALAIPLLPEPTRRQVTIAYLLFRIADTFEDAARWPRARRIEALATFERLLAAPDPCATAATARVWAAEVPCDQPGYRDLLTELPQVLDAFFEMQPAAVELTREHTLRTCSGMAGFVARTDDRGELHLRDLDDLRGYCYVVAGIVGELLTELFLLGEPVLAPGGAALRERSRAFGEGLQLVNILKDSAADAAEGRRYLPAAIPRSEVFALARANLRAAAEYVLLLQSLGAERGLVAFTALPVELARATLSRVEASGPGAKLTRPEVYALAQRVHRALDRGEPALAPGTAEPHGRGSH
ncbi:MAG TPA: squalene/phytoene synthase family protein [Thermoanaerobaculia bacterium]|nr:squalene/phytoene synthase family protein [Thermoanaerobaculia bacterium]